MAGSNLGELWDLGSLLFSAFFLELNGWREAVEVTPDFVPQGNGIEEHPAVDAHSLSKESRLGPFLAGFIGSDEDAETSHAVVGGVDGDDGSSKGSDGDLWPA